MAEFTSQPWREQLKMTELINDICMPSELVVPLVSGASTAQPVKSGAIFVSGSLLYYHISGAAVQLAAA